MLYFFYGTDGAAARAKARELLESLQKEEPDARVFRIDPERWVEVHLEELIGGQGLFEQKLLVFADRLFENEEAEAAIEKNLSEIGKSNNIFIFLEQKVRKPFLLEITEVAEEAEEFASKEAKKKPEFDIFSLTDAFGRRDKKNLWALFQKAVASGAAPEEIHGMLFWQLKSMLLAMHCKNAEEAGVKPFVWSKARTFAKNWSEGELKKLSSRLVSLYHDSHRGLHEFPIALERLILSL